MQVDWIQQWVIICLCIQCGFFLLQYGVESVLVEELLICFGLVLGMDSVESVIFLNVIVLIIIKNGECFIFMCKNVDCGINMYVVMEVQYIVIFVEYKLLDYCDVEKCFVQIVFLCYLCWLLVLMVGFFCVCFCKLNNGGWDGVLVSFCVSMVVMYICQMLIYCFMYLQINFCIIVFVVIIIFGLLLCFLVFVSMLIIVMVVSVLLLVLGFLLINVVVDMFKGYINIGFVCWVIVSLLIFVICIGVVMVMIVWGLCGWV